MKKMKLVTVIIPVYNVGQYLSRCIQSVINQSYNNMEIILIDDGSTDNSGMICDNYKNIDNRIKVIHKKNQGVSVARNIGLDISKGYYISFIDADDYIEKDMIEKLVTSIETAQSDMAICNYYYNKTTNLENIMHVTTVMEKILSKEYFRGFVWNKLYKREMIDKIRFNDKIYIAEDLLFNCEYLLKCQKCSCLNERLYYHCENDTSALNKKLNSKYLTILDAYERIEKIYKKNYNDIIGNLYIDMLKIACNIIYRNGKHKKDQKLDLTKIYYEKERYYKILMKTEKIPKCKKAEIYLYNRFPVLIGNIRNLKIKYSKLRFKESEKEYGKNKNRIYT